MARTDDNLLDLSAWPAPPPRLGGVPPRPTRRPRSDPLGLVTPVRGALLLGVLAAALLLVPTGRCASPRSVPAQTAAPSSAHPHPSTPVAAHAPKPQPRATTVPRAVSRHVVSGAAVHAAAAAVTAAQSENDAASADLDRLLAAQQSSSNPASYDEAIDAAQDRVNESQSALDDANTALAQARAGTTTTTVVRVPTVVREQPRSSPKPRPTPVRTHPEPVASAPKAVARSCATGSGVPRGVGGGLVLASAGLGVYAWRRRT